MKGVDRFSYTKAISLVVSKENVKIGTYLSNYVPEADTTLNVTRLLVHSSARSTSSSILCRTPVLYDIILPTRQMFTTVHTSTISSCHPCESWSMCHALCYSISSHIAHNIPHSHQDTQYEHLSSGNLQDTHTLI